MTSSSESSDERRVVTLNIQHGGGKVRVGGLASRLLSYDADVLVVTEFRANEFGERLIAELHRAGYATAHPGVGSAQNSVLVASRGPIDRSWAFSDDLDARHLLCVDLGWSLLSGVYMPLNTAKLPYWEALIANGRRSGIDLFVGDFNTGNNDLDKDPKGTRFIGPQMPGRLMESGYEDLGRSFHPDVREYSWFSPGVNNASVSTTLSRLRSWRSVSQRANSTTLRGTDHAALVISLARL